MLIKFWVRDRIKVFGGGEVLEKEYRHIDLSDDQVKSILEMFLNDPPNMLHSNTTFNNQAIIAAIEHGPQVTSQFIENWKRDEHIRRRKKYLEQFN